jgi:hypothetical protein
MPAAFERSRARRPSITVATMLFAAACAQNPETIAPAPVDEARYGGLHCAELAQEMARLNRELAILSTEQHAKRVNDAVAWAHLFFFVHSARTRDIRPSIALDKGQLESIERTMARRCTGLRS